MKQQILEALVGAFMSFKVDEDWITPKSNTISSKSSEIMKLEDAEYDETKAEAVGQIAHGVLAAVAEGMVANLADQDLRKTATPEFAGVSLVSNDWEWKAEYVGKATGSYYESVILLHEAYDGTTIDDNLCFGFFAGSRGAVNAMSRKWLALVATGSAYDGLAGCLIDTSHLGTSEASNHAKLVTCKYNGIKYMAIKVPYSDGVMTYGFTFHGYIKSTAEKLKVISYYHTNNGVVNSEVYNSIQDYIPPVSWQVDGNFKVSGKLTAASVDPEYVHYEENTRAGVIEGVKRDMPTDKLGGAVMFYNKEAGQMEYFVPNKGEFRNMQNEVVAQVESIIETTSLEPEEPVIPPEITE